MIYSVVLIVLWESDSVIHAHTHARTHIYILFIFFSISGLSQDIDYSSLCDRVGPCCHATIFKGQL